MKTLILPVAGASSRFPGMRPKWLLTMPDGKLMVEKSIELLDVSNFDRIILVCLKRHLEEFISLVKLTEIFNNEKYKKVEFCVLENPTKSQSETIALAIEKSLITGSIYIKDCDNQFEANFKGENSISVIDLNDVGLVDAKNKSYIQTNALGHVTNIVEKKVISNLFCCGGYGFKDANEFLEHYYKINSDTEVYISNVIYSMLMSGELFTSSKATKYVDWGTLREYRDYMRSFLTVFCDVDGVLLNNGSKFSENGWNTEPIPENIQALKRLQDKGLLYLVITSSRPQSQFEYVATRLLEYGVKIDAHLMGLPHTQRVLINDYSNTNAYPTAISINLERDSKKLNSIIQSIGSNAS